jgi:hypothetical protein
MGGASILPIIQPSDLHDLPERPPPVWYGYIALCILMALMNVGLVFLGLWFLGNQQMLVQKTGYTTDLIVWDGDFFIICGLVFALANLILPLFPKKPWTYVFHLVNIISAGLTCVLLPVAVPVLIGWLKPEARALFHFK